MAECIQINEKTWRIEDGGVRFLLLCGTGKAALIDTGMNTPDAREIADTSDTSHIFINLAALSAGLGAAVYLGLVRRRI